MTLKVVIAGATGWVGRELVKAVLSADDLMLVGAVAREAAGRDVAEAIGQAACGIVVSSSLDRKLAASADVLIDHTRADVAKANCLTALAAGCAVVIGSSGLMGEDFTEIEAAANAAGVGVIASGNFSITATLMKRFALEAAKYVADVEIVEYAGASQPDVPSGTTVELADALAMIRQDATTIPVGDLSGKPATRGDGLGTPKPVQVHAVRLPSYLLSVEVQFGADSERLTLRHDAGASATPYIDGTLLAARRVRAMKGLTRGLDHLL